MRGPIDYIIVGFEGNKFDGSILQALTDALDKGIIALVALAMVIKDADGKVSTINLSEIDDSSLTDFAGKYQPDTKLLTQEDVAEAADLLQNNTSAGILVVEQLWAKPLKEALIKANGVLVAEGRIHPDAAAELNKKGN